MSGFLRFIGITNAAVWFGGGLVFTLVVLPGLFSHDAHQVLRVAPDSPYYMYYPGALAEVLFRRYFAFQYVCGIIALLHLLAEKLYLGRSFPPIGTAVVIGILLMAVLGGASLEPHMEALHQTMYFGKSPDLQDAARHSFNVWHGTSQLLNVLMLAGLLIHLLRVARPEEPGRYGTLFPKFRG